MLQLTGMLCMGNSMYCFMQDSTPELSPGGYVERYANSVVDTALVPTHASFCATFPICMF